MVAVKDLPVVEAQADASASNDVSPSPIENDYLSEVLAAVNQESAAADDEDEDDRSDGENASEDPVDTPEDEDDVLDVGAEAENAEQPIEPGKGMS
ncbi:MAG TPA: hypothetical protein V6D20_23660 [Candidatus Obscuribacterales bacterium]